jgi:hypothetical protein
MIPPLFLFTFNIHLYMHIFSCIFLSNYWWQESDIWSQALHRYAILWEAFLDPSDSYFLFAEERGYDEWAFGHKLHIGTPYRGKRFWTGSRNLTGPKTLPTIWHTYMKLVIKYQIPVMNICWEKYDEKCAYTQFILFKMILYSNKILPVKLFL